MIAVGMLLLAPFTVGAITQNENIAILQEAIDGLVRLVKLAYCAQDVTALCD